MALRAVKAVVATSEGGAVMAVVAAAAAGVGVAEGEVVATGGTAATTSVIRVAVKAAVRLSVAKATLQNDREARCEPCSIFVCFACEL
jgi:hypothetical protein